MENEYTKSFYEKLQATALQSAATVVDIVMPLLRPDSVADIGCGTGAWLRRFAESGVSSIRGYDGEWVPRDQLLIPQGAFIAVDLTNRMPVVETVDLAVSLEVGEHLPETMAEALVECLCRASSLVLFSAAIPGQGGTHHINLQWPWYWRSMFRSKGYSCVDAIRPQVWCDTRVDWVYRQNIYLFVEDTVLASRTDLLKFKLLDSMQNLTVVRESVLARQASFDAQPFSALVKTLVKKVGRRLRVGR